MPKRRSANPRTMFAFRLIKAREAFGIKTNRPELDQKEFAYILGFGVGQEETYRRYERGEVEPPLRTLAAIHRITGASLDDLIGIDPTSPPAIKIERENVKPFPQRKRVSR